MASVDIGSRSPLETAVLKIVDLLEEQGVDYFFLGGIAIGVLGEPRFTQDVDLDIFLKKDQTSPLLKKARKEGFDFNQEQALETTQRFGTFRLIYAEVPIDFILASTDLENSALRRRVQHPLFGKQMWFPSPEDLILFNLIPGRQKDLVDAESVVLRHRDHLDISYLQDWASKVCEQAEDFRVQQLLRKLLQSPLS